MKKILYVINGIKNTGPNKVLENMIKGINKEQYEIFVVSFLDNTNNTELEKLNSLGAKIIELKMKKKLNIFVKGKAKLQNIIEEIKPDVIHSHGIMPDYVMSKIKTSANKVTTIHSNIFEDYIQSFGKFKGKLYIKLHLHSLKNINKVICCSKSSYDVLNKYITNIFYVRNGIENIKETNNENNIKKKLGIKGSDTIYLYVGGISTRKNVIFLLDNFKKYSLDNEHIIILGYGPLFSEAKKYHSNRIHILGHKDNAIDYMKISDIYISASKSEGFSISIIEALQNNLFLFISDIPSHKEVFKIDDNYYLGETFKKEDFNLKLELLRKNMQKYNNDKMLEFKEKYLSARHMMQEYVNYY